MITKDNEPIYIRKDGTYEIQSPWGRYHVCQNDKDSIYSIEELKEYISIHDGCVSPQPEASQPTIEERMIQARELRNALLSSCDWTQLPDASVRCDQSAWAKYRQALADWPSKKGFPDISTMPKAPK